jgi:hypothetical protein
MWDFNAENDCVLCGEVMTVNIQAGQIYCLGCELYCQDGHHLSELGENIPYVYFKGQRYRMEEWQKYLNLKAFW